MVLFDSLSVRDEAVKYSVELARRMDYSLIMLVLLALDSEDAADARDIERRAREALQGPISSARQAGVDLEAEVRLGDPSSELLKFLAGSRSVHTIVWGGPRKAGDPMPDKMHWLNKMKDMLKCPVVVPKMKS